MRDIWDADFTERSPMFAPLRAVASELRASDWPDCDELNRIVELRAEPLTTASGQRLRFVTPRVRPRTFEHKYEASIFLRGQVELRACNWHDLLNGLVWLTFPRAKAALNQRHYRELERQRECGRPNRGAVQDALTLFDEGGVIIATSDWELATLLSACRWQELFWQRRAEVIAHMRFYLFGHALYEKALHPFVGVTGRGVIMEADDRFFDQPLGGQLREVDLRLARYVADPMRFTSTRELAPLPVLGVPGWCGDNNDQRYYDDLNYFRPLRKECL